MTQTISYRRPGCGGSDPLSAQLANGLHSIDSVATQLDSLLFEARITSSFVLVASSIGAWIADRYAARSPRGITGMVLIDPANLSPWPDLDPQPPITDGNDGETGYLRKPPRTATPNSPAPRCCVRGAPLSFPRPTADGNVTHPAQAT